MAFGTEYPLQKFHEVPEVGQLGDTGDVIRNSVAL